MKKAILAFGLLTATAACEVEPSVTAGGTSLREVPPEVAAIAAPGQDLSSVEVLDDNCFWYRHTGPVETTMLPLRSREGRPICVQVQEAAA